MRKLLTQSHYERSNDMTTSLNDIEQKLGKPVTSSNHAMAWHLLNLIDTKIQNSGLGSLFSIRDLGPDKV